MLQKPRAGRRRGRPGGWWSVRWRSWAVVLAAWPLFQTAACWPDPLAALNFELQSMANTVFINAANTIIQNLLGI